MDTKEDLHYIDTCFMILVTDSSAVLKISFSTCSQFVYCVKNGTLWKLNRLSILKLVKRLTVAFVQM